MQGLDCRNQRLAQVVSVQVTGGLAGLVWGGALALGAGGVRALLLASALHGCEIRRREE